MRTWGLYCKKKKNDLFMQFTDEDVDYVLRDEDWLCTVT